MAPVARWDSGPALNQATVPSNAWDGVDGSGQTVRKLETVKSAHSTGARGMRGTNRVAIKTPHHGASHHHLLSTLSSYHFTTWLQCPTLPCVLCPHSSIRSVSNLTMQHEFTPDTSAPMREQVAAYIKSLQLHICAALESVENAPGPSGTKPEREVKFVPDAHIRASNTGFGISATLNNGQRIEKAGVGVSVVMGKLPPAAIEQMKANHKEIVYDPSSGESLPYLAAGLSLIVHPRNPMAPTVHLNYRYFELCESAEFDATGTESAEQRVPKATGERRAWWFAGGCDLTPSYVFPEDAVHFHQTVKDVCDSQSTEFYPIFKKWCDEYFYIPHRQEGRGLGGIFYDDLSGHAHDRLPSEANGVPAGSSRPKDPTSLFAFMRKCGDAFVPSYLPILAKRADLPYTEDNRRWQLLRRGRYVEFNLMYDRGTKFGLMAPGARIESILMSLPETARWEYYTDMGKEGTPEGDLVALLKTPKAWV